MTGPAEVLEGGTGPSWWRTRWSALPKAARRLVAVVAVLVLLAAGVAQFRTWSAERAVRQAVVLTAALDVTSSSSSPPGGEVRYFVRIRNDGASPVRVTSVDGAADGLRLRMGDGGGHPVDAGAEIQVPLSARLSCGDRAGGSRGGLAAEIGVRREDGGSTTRRVDLEPAALLLDAARTLCAVRPGLRDHELSGPVLRPR